jgi:SSS family solute:Na+ symporter
MTAKIAWLTIFLVVYWGYCIFWGIKGALSARTASDYFIAGRKISLWVFVLAATATSYSGWTFIGHPGLEYADGFPYAFASFYTITIPFSGVLFLKRQWMLGKRYGFVTPGEMFSAYFRGDGIRLLTVLVALCFSVPYLGLQLRASGFLFHILTDQKLGIEVGMWMLSAIVFIYVASGGLRAVAYVDTAQAVLLALGIVIIGIVAVHYVGGWAKLNQAIAAMALDDTKKTAEGYSHYVAIPGVIQFVSSGPKAVGGAWTGVMILTYMFALMGIQASPAFSMWAFSNNNPKPFAPQQVWASSVGIGLILFFFTAMQGIGGHFLGADTKFAEAHPDLVNNVLGPVLGNKDIMALPGKQGNLVPALIHLTAPWMVGLLAVCALAAMQSTGAAYMSTAGGMLMRDLLKRYVMPNASHAAQKFWGRIGVLVITGAALVVATYSADALVLLGGLAVAFGFQMYPALMSVCYFPWFTRQGITWGLAAGIVAVIFTESFGQTIAGWFGITLPWGRWPWTIHSAGWGIIFNFSIAIIVSALTQESKETQHRLQYHSFLRDHASLSAAKRSLVPAAWIMTLVWFFFGIGPGAVIGNTIFGNPQDYNTWTFGMPSIWAWQILWWLLGIFMMWFLAYKMDMSTVPDKEIVALQEDIGDIRLDLDKP